MIYSNPSSPVFGATVHLEKHNPGFPAWRFLPPVAEDISRLPPVLVLHGLNSRKERHLELGLRLAEAGFQALLFDLRSHGDRRDADSPLLLGDRSTPEFAGAFTRCVTGTIQDISRVADYFEADLFGLVGHSMGGYISLQTSLVEPRIAALAVLSGSLDISDGSALSDIAARAAEVVSRPVLLLHGTEDTLVPFAGALKFHSAFSACLDEENRDRLCLIEYPGVGHELTAAMLTTTVEWLQARLLPPPAQENR